MSVQRFVQKDPRIKGPVAAKYEFGTPLDDLLSVAYRLDADASIVEIPAWRVLLVRHTYGSRAWDLPGGSTTEVVKVHGVYPELLMHGDVTQPELMGLLEQRVDQLRVVHAPGNGL